jgi:hypothetical protein
MTTSMTISSSVRWQHFFSGKPCEHGWSRFAEAVEKHGLEAAVRRASESDRRWGAEHTYRVDILAILAQDEDVDVRRYVASNPHTPAETLSALATDEDANVRYRIASNAHTPVETLSALATDAHYDVRCCVAKNPQTPAEVLATLATDAYADVRDVAQDRLQSTDARASLADPDH